MVFGVGDHCPLGRRHGRVAAACSAADRAARRLTETQRDWRAWCAQPLPDHQEWDALWRDPEKGRAITSTSKTPLDELQCSGDCDFHLYDVYDRISDDVRPYFGVYRKDYALSALFSAGP
ncbi:hypothetical protein [Streptomyces sp. NPDC002889]|uniref:hypothetical protein n=1 Tax=Streptomyces sp. NPDC002889 TaxID=3364669 RepID=UPI0036C0211D